MKTRNIGLLVSIITFILLYLLLAQIGDREEKQSEYKGILIETFIDNNRAENTYKIRTSQGTIYTTVRSYQNSYNYIEIGDSVIKEKGKLDIIVKKKKSNFKVSATFPYE